MTRKLKHFPKCNKEAKSVSKGEFDGILKDCFNTSPKRRERWEGINWCCLVY